MVRIPAAVQADAGTPRTKPSSALNVTTADGEEQTEPAQRRSTLKKKIWASKGRKTREDMTALGKSSQDDCAECGPDGADISTQLRASWHRAYDSSTGTESE